MKMNMGNPESLIREALARRIVEDIELQLVDGLPQGVNGIVPEGWLVYYYSFRSVCRVGGDKCLAYNPANGEVMLLGVSGE